MSICLDPTHLVTCLLINFPQLFSLVTLIICSLYNLLVFAVPCGFVTLCLMSSVSSLVQPCPALPCLLASQLVFPLRGSFCLFVLFLLNKLVAHNLHLSLRSLPFTPSVTIRRRMEWCRFYMTNLIVSHELFKFCAREVRTIVRNKNLRLSETFGEVSQW